MIGETNVPARVVKDKRLGDQVHTLWDTKILGLTTLLKYFNQDLNIPFAYLSIRKKNRSDDFSKNIREFVNYINSSGIALRDIDVGGETSLSDEDLLFLLENVSVTGTFRSSTEASEKFKFTGKIQAESISIKNAHWFTVENLMSSVGYKEITILGSKFTHEQVKSFLQSWKSGNFPNLQKVEIETDMPDCSVVLRGFKKRPQFGSRSIFGHGTAYGVVTKRSNRNVFEMRVGHSERGGRRRSGRRHER